MRNYKNKTTAIAERDFIRKNRLNGVAHTVINGLKQWSVMYCDDYRITYIYAPSTEQSEIVEEYFNDDNSRWERLSLLNYQQALKMRAA